MTKAANSPSIEDLGRISDLVKLKALQPFLEQEIDKMAAGVHNRVFAAIREENLTADFAKDAWLELYAYKRLLKNITTHMNLGVEAAKKVPNKE